jgi:hypothetical protein
MRTLYAILAALILLLGLVHLCATFLLFDGLSSRAIWFASGGLALILTGLLNLLNRSYGATAPGLRWVTVGADAAMTVFAVLAGAAGAAPTAQIIVIAGVIAAATGLSVRPPAADRRQANG